MTLSELRARVRSITRVSELDWSDADLTALINEGLRQVAANGVWPWLEKVAEIQVTAGTHTYDLPEDVERVIELVPPGKRPPLGRMSLRQGMLRYGATTPGNVLIYSPVGVNKVRLFPTPSKSGTYILIYQKQPGTLTSNNSTPPFHAGYHYILAEWAAYQVFRKEEMDEEATRARAEFVAGIRELRRVYRESFDLGQWQVGGDAYRIPDSVIVLES